MALLTAVAGRGRGEGQGGGRGEGRGGGGRKGEEEAGGKGGEGAFVARLAATKNFIYINPEHSRRIKKYIFIDTYRSHPAGQKTVCMRGDLVMYGT